MPLEFDPAQAPAIEIPDAKAEFDRGAAVFVDVRSREQYERSHIPGAMSIPLRELARHLDELSRDRLLIFY